MGQNAQITVLDTVHCKANKEARYLISPCLTIKVQTSEKTEDGYRLPGTKEKNLITGYDGSAGHFLTGYLPRIKRYCRKNNLKIVFKGSEEKLIANTKNPKLKDISFRPDQSKAIRKAIRKGRGLIVAPTGSGKTVVALGLFLCFKSMARLFLCHTNDIYNQTIEELKKRNFKNVFEITSKTNWEPIHKIKNPILISKVQSFAKVDVDNYIDFIDMVMVDEVHHVNKINSQYGRIMQHLLAPIRIGLTATVDPNIEKNMNAEGLFGPILYKLKISEGVELGIIAKPIVDLIPVTYDIEINKNGMKKFNLLYRYGIVENKYRNDKISEIAKVEYNNNGSILIIVEKIEHGKIIQLTFKKKKLYVPFIHGSTPPAERNQAKKDMVDGHLRLTICSRVWKEGINIPRLTMIVNASGYKDEKGVIQTIGRGLRTTKEKKTVKLVDFLDPYRFLAEHSIARISIYKNEGWI